MYENRVSPDDPWFSPERVDRHLGSREDYVHRVKAAVVLAVGKGKPGVKSIAPFVLKWVSDARMLREAWDLLASKGGATPGPNGRHYDDLEDPEVWELLKTIGKAIRNGTYRVGRERIVHIPKSRIEPSRGTRPISLIDIEDRVVQRAVVEVLQPLLDPLLAPNVLGFRPRIGRMHALALAEHVAVAGNRYVFAVEDIKDAFTNVPINRLLDVLKIYVPAPDLLKLIRRLLDTGHKHGIRQGGPLSPLLLNIYLHHFFDGPWQKRRPDVPMIRVADDLLLICRTQKEARAAHAELESLLRAAGMPVKGTAEGSVCDLRKGVSASWLGFKIAKGDQALKVKIAEKAWDQLAEHLLLAHLNPDPSIRAALTINGWVEQLGPCYPFVRRAPMYARLAKIAAEQAFDEIPSRDAVIARWRRAYRRWREVRDEVKEHPPRSAFFQPAVESAFTEAVAAGDDSRTPWE